MTVGCAALIKDHNASFNEYAWATAKLMLVKAGWLNDSDPIPEKIAMDPECEQELASAREQLQEAIALSEEEAQKRYEQAYADDSALKGRYEAMIKQVEAWQPSSKLDAVKALMRLQLQISARECDPVETTGEQYKRCLIQLALERVNSFEKNHERNRRIVESLNELLFELRKSLGEPPRAT